MSLSKIGLIQLVDRHGGHAFMVESSLPDSLRARQLTWKGRLYEQWQHAQTHWIYREIEAAPQGAKDDYFLSELTYEGPPQEPITWNDVDAWFAYYRYSSEPVPMPRVRELEGLLTILRNPHV